MTATPGSQGRQSRSPNCRTPVENPVTTRNGFGPIVAPEGGGRATPPFGWGCGRPRSSTPQAAVSGADLELAQHVVQARLEIRLCASPAHDERARDLIPPGGELLRPRPGHDDRTRRYVAPVLDRL